MINFKFCWLFKSKWDQHVVLQKFVGFELVYLHIPAQHLGSILQTHTHINTHTHKHTHKIKPTNILLDNSHSSNSNISYTNYSFGPKIFFTLLILNAFIQILLC